MDTERRNGQQRQEILRRVMDGKVAPDDTSQLMRSVEAGWRAEGELFEGQPHDVEIVQQQRLDSQETPR
ncbi:hypothetical protein HYV21_00175 [Candidatus Microgenomates bacterium]|nr:hypothetical protein [Candidatus Microgenomates bacterium]